METHDTYGREENRALRPDNNLKTNKMNPPTKEIFT